MMKRILFLLILLSVKCPAQDLSFGRMLVDTLTSQTFWGRGYTKDGMHKAADFLAAQMKSYGLKPMNGKDFQQFYSYSVNTFPDKMDVSINGKKLTPGKDFIVSPESRGVTSLGGLVQLDSVQFVNKESRLIVKLEDKLTWSAEQSVADYTTIEIDRRRFTDLPSSFDIDIVNKFEKKFKASNICGIVPGTQHPDSFFVISAHYDHLGGMGKDTYFPGANDNASGVSLLMNLAHYYATHPQPYTMCFILFSGEEAGLVGSKYFTEHPLIPLDHIRFLINTDLAGTGVDGITVVNASEFPKEFALMQKINDDNHLLAAVNSRGKAANSDHYFFTEKGVPSFFFYTLGGTKAYHDIYDISATLPMNEHEDLFRLVKMFFEGAVAH